MTGPRLAADVLAEEGLRGMAPIDAPAEVILRAAKLHANAELNALLAGADMVALVRTDAGVEVRGLEYVGRFNARGALSKHYRLVDAPVPADTQEADRG